MKTPEEKISFEIINQTEFDADEFGCGRHLTPLNGCTGYEEGGLGEWTYQFEVDVTNKQGEKRCFTIAYQPEERSNGMKAYSGYDIAPASLYGYDADESSELESFCDDDTTVTDELYRIAKNAAKAHYKDLLQKLEEGEIEISRD